MINLKNYEAYLLDYSEGNLNDQEIDMLLNFLDEHPELAEELNFIHEVKLKPAEGFKMDAELLKITDLENDPVSKHNFETYSIAVLEGEVKEDKKQEVEQFADQSPALRSDFELIQRLKLKEDRNIAFENKEKLYRSAILVNWKLYLRVAAVLLLIAASYTLWQSDLFTLGDDGEKRLASNQSEIIEKNNMVGRKVSELQTNSGSEKGVNTNENVKNTSPKIENKALALTMTNKNTPIARTRMEKGSSLKQKVDLKNIEKSVPRKIRLYQSEPREMHPEVALIIPLNTNETGNEKEEFEHTDKDKSRNKLLSVKQFLVKVIKVDVLRSESEDYDKITHTDLNPSLSKITKGKASFQTDTLGKTLLVFNDSKIVVSKKK